VPDKTHSFLSVLKCTSNYLIVPVLVAYQHYTNKKLYQKTATKALQQ